MAATAPAPRLAGSTPRSPRAVMSWRASSGLPAVAWAHGGADLVAHVVAEAAADERRDGRRAERRRPDRGARLALDQPRSGPPGAGSPVRTARIAQAGSSSSLASR